MIASFYIFSFANSVWFSASQGKLLFMFIYLSRWNLFGTMVCTTIGACLATSYYRDRIKSTNRRINVLKCYWLLYNNCVVFACVITGIYWSLLHEAGNSGLNNYLVHATNSAPLVIDLFVVRHPHRYSHFVYPMTSGALYMFFTVAYSLCGGVDDRNRNFVYPVLDWVSNPKKAAIVGCGCVILLAMTHVLVCLVHSARARIHRKLIANPEVKPEQSLPFVNFREKNKSGI